jgi:hypothetical protein
MLVALSMLIFLLLRLTPGDPIDAYIDPNLPMSPTDLADLRRSLGLDQPLPVQYLGWLHQALTGNLGYSIKRLDQPVLGLVLSRIGPTVLLMGTALAFAIVAGITFGVIGAVRRNSLADLSLSVVALAGISSPAFLSALIGLYIFSVRLHWMPSGGMLTPGEEFSLGDLLHRGGLDLLGAHEPRQLHLHQRPPTEAPAPFGIGQVVAADLDGVDGCLDLLQKGIRTGLDVLEPPRRGEPRLGHHGQHAPRLEHPQGIHRALGVGGEHALGEAPEPADQLAQGLAVKIESSHNEVGRKFAKDAPRVHEIGEGAVVA